MNKKLIYTLSALLSLAACNDDNNMQATNTPDHTGEVTRVTPVTAELSLKLSADRACYKPGEKVVLAIEGQIPAGSKIRFSAAGQTVEEHNLSGNTFEWTAPATDFTGYLADIYHTDGQGAEVVSGSIGIDVSSDWTRFPRYGFVAAFDGSKLGEGVIEGEMAYLNRCHINGVQFQDWHNKHHWPLGGTRDKLEEVYKDIANRDTYTSVIKKYIEVQHAYGMKSMFYNLCYGALKDAAADGVKKEWYVFKDQKHSEKVFLDLADSWKSDIFLLDPSNPEWQNYIADRNDDVYHNFDFDGYQIDQLGDWGTLYDYNGGKVNMQKGYASFIEAMKKRHPEKRLVMNAVSSFGSYSIAGTEKVDFLYNELWDSEASFSSLYDVIHANDLYSDHQLKTVFAAYMDYKQDNTTFNVPGVLLTDATMFALGGSHLELGDHMLCREYFPYTGVTMTQELKDRMVDYYDFMTAYQNLLRDGGTERQVALSSPDYTINAWPPAKGAITSFGRKVGDRQTISLLNFMDADQLSWRDMNGTMPEPRLIQNLPLTLTYAEKVNKVWVATPDALGGVKQELAFKQAGGKVTFTLPSLKYWTLIVIE